MNRTLVDIETEKKLFDHLSSIEPINNSKIGCTDGVYRDLPDFISWLKHLVSLYRMEPSDLTEEEIEVLEDEGFIEVDFLGEEEIDPLLEKPWDCGKHFS